MDRLMDLLERLTLAVTFAEVNEHQTALQLLRSTSTKKSRVQENKRPRTNSLRQEQDQAQQDLRL